MSESLNHSLNQFIQKQLPQFLGKTQIDQVMAILHLNVSYQMFLLMELLYKSNIKPVM